MKETTNSKKYIFKTKKLTLGGSLSYLQDMPCEDSLQMEVDEDDIDIVTCEVRALVCTITLSCH